MLKYEDIVKQFTKLPKADPIKQDDILEGMFNSHEFWKFVYDANRIPNIAELTDQFYVALSHPKSVKAIVSYATNNLQSMRNRRNAAVLFMSLANFIENSNKDFIESVRANAHMLNKKETEARLEIVTKIDKAIRALHKGAKDLTKKMVRKTADETNLPKGIVRQVYHIVPSPEDFGRYRVSAHVANTLKNIYRLVSETGTFIEGVDWREFFKDIFTDEYRDVAVTIILVEGIDNIKNLPNIDAVKRCWDSLTKYALGELEGSDTNRRLHMLDLYIKRVDRMYQNGSRDLRIDLLGLDSFDFPNLVKDIVTLKDKILEIIKKPSENEKSPLPSSPEQADEKATKKKKD